MARPVRICEGLAELAPPLAGMIRGGRSSATSNKCSHGLPEVRPSTGYNKTCGAQRPQPLQELAEKSRRELAVDFASSRLKRLQLVLTG